MFLIDTLTKESGNNNIHAKVMRDTVVKRISERRNHVIVHLMKYLVNGDVPNTVDVITGAKITKTSMHAKANAMFSKLFGHETTGSDDPDVILEEEE